MCKKPKVAKCNEEGQGKKSEEDWGSQGDGRGERDPTDRNQNAYIRAPAPRQTPENPN